MKYEYSYNRVCSPHTDKYYIYTHTHTQNVKSVNSNPSAILSRFTLTVCTTTNETKNGILESLRLNS